MHDAERRFLTTGLRIERRADNKTVLAGHAAVFNERSENLGGFREIVAPGAFAEALKKDDVRALFNHDANFVLGRSAAKTLRLAEDDRGLAYEVDLPDTQTIRDLVIGPVERGDISGSSFGFRVLPNGQNWTEDDEGVLIRTLTAVRLYDVSPVTFPAYPQTDVALRCLNDWRSARPPAFRPLFAAARTKLIEADLD